MDFSTPSVKQVSDFFMYLYQDLRRPSTIDGYRMAMVDTLGPAGLHISQSLDLNRLLSSVHIDHPKTSSRDSIPPSVRRWLLVTWSADFANVGPSWLLVASSIDIANGGLPTTTQVRYLYILPMLGQCWANS